MSTKQKVFGVGEKDGYATKNNNIKAHWEIETCFAFRISGREQ